MHNPVVHSEFTGKKRGLSIIAGLFVALALLLVMPAAQASATDFCGTWNNPAWVNPYGQGGDRCWGPAQYLLNWGGVRTYERAGCVTLAEGTDLLTSWVCGAAGSKEGFAVTVGKWNGGYWWKGVVRNNNLTYGTHISGGYACLYNSC